MTNIECSIVIPCFNESPAILEETVRSVQKALLGTVKDFEIIAVNDGSTKYQYDLSQLPGVKLIDHGVNYGYGSSLKTGIRHARFDWIGIIDSDGTYPADKFRDMAEKTVKYDMIIGSRDWRSISIVRQLAKRPLTLIASLLAGYPIPDLNSGMRLFKRNLVDDHIRIYPGRFSFSTTLTMVGVTGAYEILFMPIEYYKRKGDSSIHPVKDTMRFLIQIFRLALYFRPLRFFMPLSFAVMALAVSRGCRDYFLNGHLGGLAIVLFFMAFQVFFFGLLAEIINKK